MLDHFQVSRHFNKLHVSMFVDVAKKEASYMVIYDRLVIRAAEPVEFHKVSTPDNAENYFSYFTGERGSFVERLEWLCRTGTLTRDAA